MRDKGERSGPGLQQTRARSSESCHGWDGPDEDSAYISNQLGHDGA
jgi:hypothetical protein